VIRLRLPALSDRREDIPLLTRHFLTRSAHELNVEAKRISESALKFLATLNWPGNVRQLENVCHWLTVMAPAQTIEVADLPPDLRETKTAPDAAGGATGDWIESLEREATRRLAAGESGIGDDLTRAFETALIKVALKQTGGRRIEASTLLGMGRNTITRKIAELKIEED
jgi:two-component system nitrogen regulation response regulator GlnG